MSAFGKRLAQLRKERGLTQGELARKLDLAQSTIASWESDARSPDISMIAKLASFFDTSVDHMLGRTDAPQENRHPLLSDSEAIISNIGQSIVDILKNVKAQTLNQQDAKKVNEFANSVLDLVRGSNVPVSDLRKLLFDSEPDGELFPRLADLESTEKIDRLLWILDAAIKRDAEFQHLEADLVTLPIVGRISCGAGVLAYDEIEGYEPTPRNWLNGGEYFYLRAKGDSMTGARIQEGDLLLIRQQNDVEDGDIAAVLIDDEAVLKRVYKRGGALWLQSENPKYAPIVLEDSPGYNVQIIGKLKKIVVDV